MKLTIYDAFHDKTLFVHIGDYERFCRLMDSKDIDTSERGEPLGLYIYIENEGGYIRLGENKLDLFIHEITHYTRDIGEKIGYGSDTMHEYYAYAMEFYTREYLKKAKPPL